jgi:hypothetical protein
VEQVYPRYEYSKSIWEDNIEKIAKNAGKHKLHEIDGVWITDKELDTISKINNPLLERLAFTMLCLAKLGNLRNPKNNGWVNNDAKEVYTLARISCTVQERYLNLGLLGQIGLLEFPKKLDNLSCRVTYIDDSGNNILFISDFRELGYEYLNYLGGNFTRCSECGRLFRNNKVKSKKYCKDCIGYTPQVKKLITCIDCGKTFEVDARVSNKTRCNDCQRIRDKETRKERNKRYYDNRKQN